MVQRSVASKKQKKICVTSVNSDWFLSHPVFAVTFQEVSIPTRNYC